MMVVVKGVARFERGGYYMKGGQRVSAGRAERGQKIRCLGPEAKC